MKQFINRLIGFSMGPIIGALITFIQIPIMTSFINKVEYGRAGLFQSLILAIPNYIYLGLDQAYTREFQNAKDKNVLIQQATLVPITLGLLLCLFSVIFASPISYWLFEDSQYTYIVYYGAFWILATILERFILLSIRMDERAYEFSMYSLVLKINVFILSMALIMMGWRDFKVIVYGLIFGQLFGDLILFWNYHHFFDLRHFTLDKPLIKQMFTFGLPVMIATSLINSLTLLDKVFLKNYASFEDIGIYSAAGTIMSVIAIVKASFTSFWVPTAYRWYEEKKDMKHFQYISEMILFVLTGIFFVLVLLKDFIAQIVVAPSYQEVKYVFALMTFPHIMYTLSETTNLGIVFSRKTYLNIFVSLFSVLPSMGMNYLLTPVWGFRGAAIASFLAYICFYFSRTYFSSRTGFHFSQVKHTLSIFLMGVTAVINAFEWEGAWLLSLVLGFLCLAVQWSTIKKTQDIKNNRSQWDFS